MNSYIEAVDFFKGNNPEKVAEEFKTPLYVYNEEIIRNRMHAVSQVITKYPYTANYSIKANTNISRCSFYFDFKQYVPGKIAYSLDEIIDAINNEDYCTEKIGPFADMFFDNRDGKATDRVVKLLYDNLK